MFVATKCWPDEMGDPEAALKRSLQRLDLEYVDLYLIHWPAHFIFTDTPLHKIWPVFESLVDQGLAKSIGVSNFNLQLLGDLLTYARIKPVVNQIELNPFVVQKELVDFALSRGVVSVAYCPIARGAGLAENETLKALSDKYAATPTQVALNWNLSRGVAVIPKSSNPERQKQNLEITHFKLTEEEIEQVNKLDRNERICTGNSS